MDPAEALQPVCAPFIQPGDYSWCIHVREQMVERYGTAEQLEEYRRQAELRGTPEHKAKNWMGSMLFHLSHANDVDHAWASSRTKEELDQVVEPFVQAKRGKGQGEKGGGGGAPPPHEKKNKKKKPPRERSPPPPPPPRERKVRKKWGEGGGTVHEGRRKKKKQ